MDGSSKREGIEDQAPDYTAPLLPVLASPSSASSTASMYHSAADGDDDDSSSSDNSDSDGVDPETVKNAKNVEAATMAKFRQDLLAELGQEDDSAEENDDEDDEEGGKVESLRRSAGEVEDFFAQSFPDTAPRDRLDTVEEVSEPLSSSLFDSLPADHAAAARFFPAAPPGESSGAASSDFQGESLPPDAPAASADDGAGSMTSREEVFSVSEVEVKHTRRQLVKDFDFDSDFELSWTTTKASNRDHQKEAFLPLLPSTSLPPPPVKSNSKEPHISSESPSSSSPSLEKEAGRARVNRQIDASNPSLEASANIGKQSGRPASANRTLKGQRSNNSTDEEEDDLSLSVSLPSGGGGKDNTDSEQEEEERRQLSQVRKGILKILGEDEEESSGSQVHPLPHDALSETDFSRRSRAYVVARSSSLTAWDSGKEEEEQGDSQKFAEKHEFENAEKTDRMPPVASDGSGSRLGRDAVVDDLELASVDEDEQESPAASMRTGPDTDSGIGRGSSSANMTAGGSGGGSNPKLWASFKRQVRKFGGSTGSLSSPSPTSEEQAATAAVNVATAVTAVAPGRSRSGSSLYSPDVARLDSPREGGFSEESLPRSAAVLKAHIKELYAQISKAESDKQKIADQAYHRATLIRRECEARLEDAKAGQEHQASLVERLRDKVVEYKGKLEAADKKAERLAKEARHSEIRFQDTNEVLKTLEERLRITEERRSEEVLRLQQRLRERDDANASLRHANAVLRAQLEAAHAGNAALAADAERVAHEWREYSREEQAKATRESLAGDVKANADARAIARLRQQLADCKRQFREAKMTTERELLLLKNDLAMSSRTITSACLNVYTRSGVTAADQHSSSVAPSAATTGKHDDWQPQVDRLRLERELSDKNARRLEECNAELRRAAEEAEVRLREATEEKEALQAAVDRLKKNVEENSHTAHHSRLLEAHNQQLQASLFDIAQIVLDDADKDESATSAAADQTVKSPSSPLVRAGSTSLLAETPLRRGRAPPPTSSASRRTRSASPAMMESTLTAVQAALNRRQLQVHGLGNRLANAERTLEEAKRQAREKAEALEAAEAKLEAERRRGDAARLGLEEAAREGAAAREKLETLRASSSTSERAREALREEVESLTKENALLNEALDRSVKESRGANQNREHVEARAKLLRKEMEERKMLVGKLEQVGSQLRSELLVTKEKLSLAEKELKTLKEERVASLEAVATAEAKAGGTEGELAKGAKREKALKEQLEEADRERDRLEKAAAELDGQLSKVEEEKLQLRVELAEKRSEAEVLKEELQASRDKVEQMTAERRHDGERIKVESEKNHKLESDLLNSSRKGHELENQLTSLTLQKDALSDEVDHVREEMAELRAQLDRVYRENATLNRGRAELEVRLEQLEKEALESGERADALRVERADQAEVIEELHARLGEGERERKKISVEKDDLNNRNESLKKELKQVKDELNESISAAEMQVKRKDEALEDAKKRYEKQLERLRRSVGDVDEKKARELEELRRKMERAQAQDEEAWMSKLEEARAAGEREKTDLVLQLERLKEAHEEELVLAESQKQQALTLAQQEQSSLKERLSELVKSLEESQQDGERCRRESSARGERDRVQIAALHSEAAKLKAQLEEHASRLDLEKGSLEDRFRREKKSRSELETQLQGQKTALKFANERLETLTEELEEARRRLAMSEEGKMSSRTEAAETEKRVQELAVKVDSLRREKDGLRADLEARDARVEELRVLVRDLESAARQGEDREEALRVELAESVASLSHSRESARELEGKAGEMAARVRVLEGRRRELELEHEAARGRSAEDEEQREVSRREAQQLRLRVSELEGARAGLEKDLHRLRSLMSGEEQQADRKITTLTDALEDVRLRERRLEEQRHSLELQLTSSQQEVKDLTVQLTGYEGRVGELRLAVGRTEAGKRDLESKLATLVGILREVRSSSTPRRPPTPSRRSSGRLGVGSSYLDTVVDASNLSAVGGELDVEAVRGDMREVAARLTDTERERDDALLEAAALKRQREELMLANVNLEQSLQRHKDKMVGTEEQLRNLENKISISDINIANQDEELLRREREHRDLSAKLDSTQQQLDELRRRGAAAAAATEAHRDRESRWESERRSLQEAAAEAEAQAARLDVARAALEGDQRRLRMALDDKEAEAAALSAKCRGLSTGVAKLEEKCSEMAATVDGLNSQLERSASNEAELQARVDELSRSLAATSSNSSSVHDQLSQLQRSLRQAEAEKELLSERLESSRQQTQELKRTQEAMEERVEHLQSEVQRSESRANQLDLQLQSSIAKLEEDDGRGGGADSYLKEELARTRREAAAAQTTIKELKKTVSYLEAEKSEVERRMHKRSSSSFDQTDRGGGRAQIPLMSSVGGHSSEGSDGAVKLKIMEQENERLIKKIRGLEAQLGELERAHSDRVQELLRERRRERDRDNGRQKEALKHAESSMQAREKIHRERIAALERQVDELKARLSAELRRRQALISGAAGIGGEVSELRQDLDRSLLAVATSPGARLDHGLLDRESARLSGAIERYSRRGAASPAAGKAPSPSSSDRNGRRSRTPLGPARLITSTPTSLRPAASVDNLLRSAGEDSNSSGGSKRVSNQAAVTSRFSSSSSARRNLSFDKDV